MNLVVLLLIVALLGFPNGAISADQSGWQRATQFYANGQYSQALSELEKLPASSSNASVHYLRGMCYKALGKSDQAQKELTWVANYAPDAKTKEMARIALGQSSGPAAGQQARSAVGVRRGPDDPPTHLINDSVSQTIQVAAQKGWAPCPGNCLNVSTPGWHHEHIDGHPETEMWHTFGMNGSHFSATTAHWGQVFAESKDAPVQNKGNCPICGGIGWVRSR
ncbi:MAG TPA: hypothetical protein V6C81_04925 [Planktothrix sp.]|jgi:hypothetical protein